MNGIEYYLIASNVVLFGVIVILHRGLGRMQTEINSMKRYAGLVTEFAVAISNKTQPEVMKAFNNFIDEKFKGE